MLKAKDTLKSAFKLADKAKDEETKEMITESLAELDSKVTQWLQLHTYHNLSTKRAQFDPRKLMTMT